ncbi:MAG: acyl-CoA thioesterase [Candidatus Marinimicrobia bacterium]|jgi:acyl-CoA hydrolase|nr:acyl-CoA thioesterase [Candidatus Neomarinimicrobiota bacterium]
MKYKARYSQLVMPDHINNVNTLFGGQMISWMDLAAAKVSFRFLKDTEAWGAVTRAIDKVEFREPVFAGEWVTMNATIASVGDSSIKIGVEAFAEGPESQKRLVCSAIITMVSVIEKSKGQFVKFGHNKTI